MGKSDQMKKLFPSLCAMLIFSACSKNDDNINASGEASLSVYLTDGPGPYDKVNIDIQSVEVHFSTDSDENKWHTLRMANPGVHNLLRLANGKDTLLASEKMAKGTITQIRLILGTNNTVVVDGVSYPLETPSAQQSGIKLIVNEQLTAGIEYKLWTDFDASRSIVVTGNGKYILKPVIRVYTKALSGSIKGNVLPAESAPWVYAMSGNDTIASAMPDSSSGNFLINGLADGNYSLIVDGANSYSDTTLTNINVTTGNVTDIGSLLLHN